MEKSIAPSAPLPELDNNALQTHMPPPTYDQAMSIHPPLVSSAHQSAGPPVLPPYPQPNMPHLPMPQPQVPYPQAPLTQPHVPYPQQVPLLQPQQYLTGASIQPSPQPNSLPSPQPNSLPSQAVIPPQEPVVTTVYVNAPVAVGPKSCRLRCPHCQADIKTSTVTDNQTAAHIACIIMCLLGCCLCSCIPYCMDSCKIVHHRCPLCKGFLGTYKA